MVVYIKCEVCGSYDEQTVHDLRLHGVAHKPDLCASCIESTKRERLEYAASECGFDSVEEYLYGQNYTKNNLQ